MACNRGPVHICHWKCKDKCAPDEEMSLAPKSLLMKVKRFGENARGRGEADRVGMLEGFQQGPQSYNKQRQRRSINVNG
jgi:hypothetical protein